MEFTISKFNKLFKQKADQRMLTIYNWVVEGMHYKNYKKAVQTSKDIERLYNDFKKGNW